MMYVPCGNFIFLSEQKDKNKTFPVEESKEVGEVLKEALKDAQLSKRGQSHEMDNYMKIAERNNFFFADSYPEYVEKESPSLASISS